MAEEKNEITYLCKYQANDLVFMYEDTELSMDPSNIMGIEISHNYDQHYQVIIKVQLRMDVRKLLWILEHKEDITCKFSLSAICVDNDNDNIISNPEYVFNEEFNIYFTDEYESTDIDMFKSRLAKNSNTSPNAIDDENYFETQNIIDIYLYNKKLIECSSKIYNEVMYENTIQNFVGRLLTKTKHEKVLMSKFENDEVYKEILIPPMPAYRALGYLDTLYGFYKKGTQIFYDYDVLYILNTIGECTAKRDKEWKQTTFLVTDVNSSTVGNGMKIIEGDEVYYISVPVDNVGTQKYSNINNEVVGNEINEVLIDDTETETSTADASYINREKVINLPRFKELSKYEPDRLKARLEEGDLSFYISGDNFDIRAFRPNHEFNLSFDDETRQKKYGGYKYRIGYVYTYIKISNTDYLESSHRIMLKKATEKD